MEHAIGKLSQIPMGEGRNFSLGDQRVAVFHARDGQVHATQAECPHRGGPLADGLTDDGTVMCPLHDRTYDFATGDGIGTDCRIRIYPVRVDAEGMVMVGTEFVGGELAAA